MNVLKAIRRSIGLTQAVALILASLVIGLGLSAVQLRYMLSEQNRYAAETSRRVLTLAEGPAASAAWTLDAALAHHVVKSVMAINGVERAVILDDTGSILAKAESESPARSRFTTWLAETFIGNGTRGRRELFIPIDGSTRKVGALSVQFAPASIAERLVSLAASTIAASVIEALLIGIILLWLSSYLVTTPLRRVAKCIGEVDPDRPEAMVLPVPRIHKENELGHLLHRTNEMLTRLTNTQQQFRNLATRDSLTNLPNRSLITETLVSAILRANRSGTSVAALFLDLDNFKDINDSLGHDVGDELLVAVACELRDTVRANDLVGRLGGDEFLIVLEGIHDKAEVEGTVERIVQALPTPMVLGGREVGVAISVGIAMFPADAEDARTLMRHADLAMYRAKEFGGSCWQFYSKEMSDRFESRHSMASALVRALDRNEFSLVYQPKVTARDRTLAGCEALLRWHHEGALLSGDEFIPLAEETGAIDEIGYWVLEQVCRQIAVWTSRYGPTSVSINVSARQLLEDDFSDRVLDAAHRHSIDPSLLELEITETILIKDIDRNIGLLGQLKQHGVKISIDDFGIGYSSLSYLARLPIHSVKIDRSFVSGSLRSEAILRLVIAMTKALELTTVAEGVESEYQSDWLTAEDCKILQGNFISRPLDARVFEDRFLAPRLEQLPHQSAV